MLRRRARGDRYRIQLRGLAQDQSRALNEWVWLWTCSGFGSWMGLVGSTHRRCYSHCRLPSCPFASSKRGALPLLLQPHPRSQRDGEVWTCCKPLIGFDCDCDCASCLTYCCCDLETWTCRANAL